MITYEMGAKEIEIELERGVYKGQKWKGTFDICENPVCSCSDVFLKITGAPAADQARRPRVHSFGISIFGKEAIEPRLGKKDEYYDPAFARTFVDDLTDENLKKIQELFLFCKINGVENASLEGVEVKFPWEKIEKQRLMMGYRDIFPWGEPLSVEVDNRTFLLDDQYCLASDCNCEDPILTFIPQGVGKKLTSYDVPHVRFNYSNKSWEVENPGSDAMPSPGVLIKEVKKQKLAKKLKRRHERLRFLYSEFLFRKAAKKHAKKKSGGKSKKNIAPAPPIDQGRKIGRNAPCPCGSGRKYKKCCLKKTLGA